MKIFNLLFVLFPFATLFGQPSFTDVANISTFFQATADGGKIMIATTKKSYGKGEGDILLTKVDAQGNEQWFKTYGGSSYDRASMVILSPDGGYVLLGSTSSKGNGNYDIWLIKTDANGKKIWDRTFGGFCNDYGLSVQIDPDEGYLITAKKQVCETNNENHQAKLALWLIKTDDLGDLQWNQLLENKRAL